MIKFYYDIVGLYGTALILEDHATEHPLAPFQNEQPEQIALRVGRISEDVKSNFSNRTNKNDSLIFENERLQLKCEFIHE